MTRQSSGSLLGDGTAVCWVEGSGCSSWLHCPETMMKANQQQHRTNKYKQSKMVFTEQATK